MAIEGLVSSASCLAVGDEVQRAKVLLINAGANSDEIRSKRCHRYVFSTEGCNTQYVSAIGNWLIKERKISRWYFLTSDYAFGHDLLRVARNLLVANKGTEVGSDLAPTGTTDFSQYITKMKAAKPDLIFHNLAGADVTNFLKQYAESGMTIEVAGGVIDSAFAWPVGESLRGHFPIIWWHELNNSGEPGVGRALHEALGPAARQPGVRRLSRGPRDRPGDRQGEVHGQREAGLGARGPHADGSDGRAQGPAADLPRVGSPAPAADVRRGARRTRRSGRTSGTSSRSSQEVPPRGASLEDIAIPKAREPVRVGAAQRKSMLAPAADDAAARRFFAHWAAGEYLRERARIDLSSLACGCAAALYVLMALGLSIIFGMIGVINFAHGALFTLGAYAAFQVKDALGFAGALVVAPVLVGLLGMLIEATLLRRLYLAGPAPGAPPHLRPGHGARAGDPAGLGTQPEAVRRPRRASRVRSRSAPSPTPKYRSFILIVVILLIAGLVLFLQKTPIGTIVRAGSRDPMMVRLLGISLTPVLTFVFGLGTALAAIAGVLSAPLAGVQPAMGVNVGTAAFVVVTIGGLGSFWGAVISGLLVGQVVSLSIYFQPRAAEASMYVLMAVILLLRPRGLMGERWEKFD